jgi:hypothetical protein
MQNEGLFRGPAGVGFLHKTSKFLSRGPYGGPHWSCSKSNSDGFMYDRLRGGWVNDPTPLNRLV